MNASARWSRWWVAGMVSMMLLGTVAAGKGSLRPADAATGPAIVNLGPSTVMPGMRAILVATNLTPNARRVTMTVLDVDGAVLVQRRPTIAPGRSAAAAYLDDTDIVQIIRGVVSIPGGSAEGWALAMRVLEGTYTLTIGPNVRDFTNNRTASSLMHAEAAESFDVTVANLGTAEADFTVCAFDAAGNVTSSQMLTKVGPGMMAGLSLRGSSDLDWFFAVVGPPNTPFVASTETHLQDGTLIEHGDIRYNSLIIVVC